MMMGRVRLGGDLGALCHSSIALPWGGAVLGSGYSFKIGYDDILLN